MYSRSMKINYWWKCEELEKKIHKIPSDLRDILDDCAMEKIGECFVEQGYSSGELLENINLKIGDLETPEDGWMCSGGWNIDG